RPSPHRPGPQVMPARPRPPRRAAGGTPLCRRVSARPDPDTPRALPLTVSGARTSSSRTSRPSPLWQTRCTKSSRPSGHGGPQPMAKVMVVDDAYSELKLMESILKSAGHDVVSLTDGETLEDRMQAEQPDVL